MKPIWSDTLDPIGSHSALTIEVVLQEPTDKRMLTVFNGATIDVPNGPCIVRTIGPIGETGPRYFRHDAPSALAKAKLLADTLRIKRRMPSNG